MGKMENQVHTASPVFGQIWFFIGFDQSFTKLILGKVGPDYYPVLDSIDWTN